jgi:hypothetical protein
LIEAAFVVATVHLRPGQHLDVDALASPALDDSRPEQPLDVDALATDVSATDVLPLINLLSAGLFDLIIDSIMQMGLLVPNAAQGRDLNQIFEHNLPKIRVTEDTRYLIGAE